MLDRFWSKTKINEVTGCIEWTGARDKDGYGIFGKPARRAHRLSVLASGRPIPPGMIVLHSCDNPPCINPDHLRIGTHSENVRDCVAKGRQKEIRKTHCANGHEYSGDNLYLVPKNGKRQCVTCRKANSARRAEKKRKIKNENRI